VKILLVNSNPVVSRLFSLCTRDASIELDEVKKITELGEKKPYALCFVDDGAYSENVKGFIESQKKAFKVFISYKSGNVSGFDTVVKKPFLPSRILTIIKNQTVPEEIEEDTSVIFPLEEEISVPDEGGEEILPLAKEKTEQVLDMSVSGTPHILDSREIEKIKDLLSMDEDEKLPAEDLLPKEMIEQRKVEVIKAQLMADGLEIVEEKEIFETIPKCKKAKKTKKSKDRGAFSKEEFALIQKTIEEELLSLKPKKVKKLLKGKKIALKLKLKEQN